MQLPALVPRNRGRGGVGNTMCLLPTRASSGKDQTRGGGGSRSHVYLNIYDLTPANNYLYWFGLGVFHSGIEVYGKEYGFGAHEYSSSGVFEVEPKSCPGFIYRRTVWLGTTDMSRSEFRLFIENLSGKYHGDTYHLIYKNCNHFTADVCMHLTGKPVPGWVNRLARLGSFCNCFLPETVQVVPIRLPDHFEYSDESESYVSSEMGVSDEESDHQLITAPNSDKPLTLARDVM